jgi:hypothetical protein
VKILNLLASVMITMLVWGNYASASIAPDNAGIEVREIKQRMQWLNHFYPDLSVSRSQNAQDLSKPQTRHNLLNQLIMLENHMGGELQLDDGTLTMLACPKTVCDGI